MQNSNKQHEKQKQKQKTKGTKEGQESRVTSVRAQNKATNETEKCEAKVATWPKEFTTCAKSIVENWSTKQTDKNMINKQKGKINTKNSLSPSLFLGLP